MRHWIGPLLAVLCALASPAHAERATLDSRTVAALTSLAEKGSARAQYELALRYEHGRGVTRDERKAADYYCRAARQGHADAAIRIGWMYRHGRGTERSEGLAAVWFHEAALRGHPLARAMVEEAGGPAPVRPFCPDRAGPPPEEVDAPEGIVKLVRKIAPEYGVDPNLVLAIMAVESNFRSRAVSPRRAQGLMQLTPATAERFGVRDIRNTAENVRGGIRYLRWLLSHFRGDVSLVLAAYNAGEGAVEKYGGIPPFRETRAYVQKVRRYYARRQHPYEPEIAPGSAILASLETAEAE